MVVGCLGLAGPQVCASLCGGVWVCVCKRFEVHACSESPSHMVFLWLMTQWGFDTIHLLKNLVRLN